MKKLEGQIPYSWDREECSKPRKHYETLKKMYKRKQKKCKYRW